MVLGPAEGNRVPSANSNMTHLLLSHGALVHSPVEATDYGFPDLVKVVNTFGHVHENVSPCSLRTERPDLPCFSHVPVVRVGQIAGTGLTVFEDTTFDVYTSISLLCSQYSWTGGGRGGTLGNLLKSNPLG